jgi:hypothetical protein
MGGGGGGELINLHESVDTLHPEKAYLSVGDWENRYERSWMVYAIFYVRFYTHLFKWLIIICVQQ